MTSAPTRSARWPGVLGRYTLEVLPTALTGTFSLTLSDVTLSDGAGDPIAVTQVLDGTAAPPYGVIAVGEDCPVAGADLSITKTDSPDPVQAGAPLTYTLSLYNSGAFDAANVTVIDTLPSQVTFQSTSASQGSCSPSGSTVTCSLGDMLVGGSASVTIDVTVNAGASGTITNSASVSSGTTDPSPGNNTATEDTFVGAAADLAIAKTDTPDPVQTDSNLTYNLTIVNNGPSDATNVVVTDTLPSQLSYVTSTASQGSCSPSAGTVTCALGDLLAAASASISIETSVTGQVSESIINTASVTSDTTDLDLANNTDTEPTYVTTEALVTAVGIDTDPSQSPANTATSLGSIETCLQVTKGQQFDIDVFVDEIPGSREFAGFSYFLAFDSTRVSIIAQNHGLLLASAPGSSLIDFSEAVPDTISPHEVGVIDFGTDEVGPVAGVLGRYTLKVPSAAPAGTSALRLTDVILSDYSGVEIPAGPITQATIAVNTASPPDGDNDSIPDSDDNCPAVFNPDQGDFDGDGLGDACDTDIDGDSVTNGVDLCPFTPLGEAVDGSGCSDSQVDGDGDGICDPNAPTAGPSVCTGSDNCPLTSNPLQEDFDGDGQGDACDPDDDGDGLPDASEPAGCELDPDCDDDNDGFADDIELYLDTDHRSACAADPGHQAWPADFNNDRVSNLLDVLHVKPTFLTSLGDPGFDKRSDLNADLAVDLMDILAIKPHFGDRCD